MEILRNICPVVYDRGVALNILRLRLEGFSSRLFQYCIIKYIYIIYIILEIFSGDLLKRHCVY